MRLFPLLLLCTVLLFNCVKKVVVKVDKIETFYVDVDYYQSWFDRGRNWLTGAIDDSRYGEQTSTIPDKVNFGAVR